MRLLKQFDLNRIINKGWVENKGLNEDGGNKWSLENTIFNEHGG